MAGSVRNLLFLCTGNSARSIMAEAYVNHRHAARFRAFSAGSDPGGAVNRLAIELLRAGGIATDGLRSKSWNEFARADAPRIDFVFTLCDQAAGEACPLWPGTLMTAHWGVADPAAVSATPAQQSLAFRRAFSELTRRIDRFAGLPIDALDRMSLKRRLDEIGRERE